MFPYDTKVSDIESASAHIILATSLRPYSLGQKISDIGRELFVTEHARNLKFGALPVIRSLALEYSEHAHTLDNLITSMVPRVVGYARANGTDLDGLTQAEFYEATHFCGLTLHAPNSIESDELSLGVALWQPNSFRSTPFKRWIPES